MIMRTSLAAHPLSLVFVLTVTAIGGNYTDINLPHEHMKYYFNSFPKLAEKCRDDAACPYKVSVLIFHIYFLTCFLMLSLCAYARLSRVFHAIV